MKPKFEPTDDAEIRCLGLEDLDIGLRMYKTFSNPPDTCDYCKTSFKIKRFMIDGNTLPGGCYWAYMCATCFRKHGTKILWGEGQMYTQMENGDWLMTGGFSPEE